MRIVVDTNIFLAVVLDEPEKPEIIKISDGAEVIAPAILPYELGNALSAMVKHHKLDEFEALSAQEAFAAIPTRFIHVDIQKALRLALDFNIYAYDACFLHCALATLSPLLTLDQKMRQIAKRLNITIWG